MSVPDDVTLLFALEPTGGGATTARQRQWYDAVVDNGLTRTVEFAAVEPGKHTVKVWRLDDNVIVERIQVAGLEDEAGQ